MKQKSKLTPTLIRQLADEYEQQKRIEENFREDKLLQIKKLQQLIKESLATNTYQKIYKPEYGNYNDFVEVVAKELRFRQGGA